MTPSTDTRVSAERVALKPCPLCGGEARSGYEGDEDGGYGFVECRNQGLGDGHFAGVHAEDEANAVMVWNTRTPEPCGLRGALAELLRTTANQAIYCSSDHAKAREIAKALLAALTKARAASS